MYSSNTDSLTSFRANNSAFRLNSDSALRALVSAQVLNEGIDVPDADVGIIVAGRLGRREHVQRVGRLLRPAQDKTALVYELVMKETAEVGQSSRRGEALAFRRVPPA